MINEILNLPDTFFKRLLKRIEMNYVYDSIHIFSLKKIHVNLR